MKLRYIYSFLFISPIIILLTLVSSKKSPIEPKSIAIESYYQDLLSKCIAYYSNIEEKNNYDDKFEAYLNARTYFKKAEPIMAYFTTEVYESLNQATILAVEELGKENYTIDQPYGFQLTEELLASNEISSEEWNENYAKTLAELKQLNSIKMSTISELDFLNLFRLQVIRIASLGIAGFDSPRKASLKESAFTYQTLEFLINEHEVHFKNKQLFEKIVSELKSSINLLETGEFDEFDRYHFIKDHTQLQLQLIQETAKDWEVFFPASDAINPISSSLFSATTFNADFFDKTVFTKQKSALGEALFNEPLLSSTGKLSCASCHQKNHYFTDSLVHFEGQKRNTPSLYYAALQNNYFYDSRSHNLQNQINQVIENPVEFNTDITEVTTKILANEEYSNKFIAAYNKEPNPVIILDAISQYIKSLHPFNSKFDRNMNGLEASLSKSEKNGFNLFMGKAECGTCHFAPVFNGTVPPYFETTEMELIGVPKDNQNLALSSDLGRFDVNNIENRKHFFKTPSIRNSSETAPYMHNGSYNTLEKVIDFYNVGGGIGLRFELPFQTLPSDSLHLTEIEIKELVAFLNSLKDEEEIY
mgnify:FL=1